jgi:hypothetical protein
MLFSPLEDAFINLKRFLASLLWYRTLCDSGGHRRKRAISLEHNYVFSKPMGTIIAKDTSNRIRLSKLNGGI